MKSLVIHGHFYQPPRDNPWTGQIEREPSASPFANWNERIHHECYRPNAWARILDHHGRIEQIVNNYRLISFNLGPTLLGWLEAHHPDTYRRILDADRESVAAHGGHGNAFAQGYNHAILPLCNERDRRTQIRWGIADFQHRFGRRPESLWLPETACDEATLEALIDEGLDYVVLSPYQAERIRPIGADEWISVADGSIDPGRPYRYRHRDGSNRSIAIFFYDGPASRSIAFEGALVSSQALIDRLTQVHPGDGKLLHLATDGESYGHHTKFGDRTLAYALEREAPLRGFRLVNYGQYLAEHPPTHDVELKAGGEGRGTSWSCAHGVGRWYRDCGCQTGGQDDWQQAWRGPLRQALDLLRDEAVALFERLGGELLHDPWAARDAYIELILNRHLPRETWLANHSRWPLAAHDQIRVFALLEMQRQAMLMYTSCGWFFNDLSGLETVQILKYAARTMDHMAELGHVPPLDRFLAILAQAQSNLPEMGNGADIYRRLVEPCRVTPDGTAAHLAMSLLVGEPPLTGEVAGYGYHCRHVQTQSQGRIRLTTCRILLESIATGARHDLAAAALHLGGVDFYCVLRPFPGDDAFEAAADRLWEIFPTASLPMLVRVAQAEFGPAEFGLDHLLPEGRHRLAATVVDKLTDRFAEQYDRLYEDHKRIIDNLQEIGFELPPELRAAAEFALGRRLEQAIRQQGESPHPADYERAIDVAADVARRGYAIDRTASRALFQARIDQAVRKAVADPTEGNVDEVLAILTLSEQLDLVLDLDTAQELVYDTGSPTNERPAGLARLASALGLTSLLYQPHDTLSKVGIQT